MNATLIKIALIFSMTQGEMDRINELALRYDVTTEHIIEMYVENLFSEYKPYAEVILEREEDAGNEK